MKKTEKPVFGPLSGYPGKKAYTAEPWREEYGLIIGGGKDETDSYLIAKILGWQDNENARRIIAAVNACAGIDTETLEKQASDPIAGIFGRMASKNGTRAEKAESERDALLSGIKALYKSYVNTIETVRDLLIEFKYPCDSVDVMEKQNPALTAARELIKKIESSK